MQIYKLIHAGAPEELEAAINEMCVVGWRVTGGVAVTQSNGAKTFYQSLVITA